MKERGSKAAQANQEKPRDFTVNKGYDGRAVATYPSANVEGAGKLPGPKGTTGRGKSMKGTGAW